MCRQLWFLFVNIGRSTQSNSNEIQTLQRKRSRKKWCIRNTNVNVRRTCIRTWKHELETTILKRCEVQWPDCTTHKTKRSSEDNANERKIHGRIETKIEKVEFCFNNTNQSNHFLRQSHLLISETAMAKQMKCCVEMAPFWSHKIWRERNFDHSIKKWDEKHTHLQKMKSKSFFFSKKMWSTNCFSSVFLLWSNTTTHIKYHITDYLYRILCIVSLAKLRTNSNEQF